MYYHYDDVVSMKASVAVVKGEHPSKMVETALEMIGAATLIRREDKVLIKPNYVVAKPPSTGMTTDPRIVESLITFVKHLQVDDIVVGEGGSGNTERAFDAVGIRDVVDRQQVRLVNLNQDARVNIKPPRSVALREVGVAKTALESTCIINVPSLKIHGLAVVTLCMKNLMGLILPKSIMHSQLHEKIVDLTSLFKDKVQINVIDGLVGSEVSEIYGSPVEMNLVIAGRDMVAVDTIGAMVMGVNPHKVRYLKLAGAEGLGVSNLDDIEILGEDIEQVKRSFRN
jgi:uncharacterized protein (DUF362 family)